jgi:hypothetical protein
MKKKGSDIIKKKVLLFTYNVDLSNAYKLSAGFVELKNGPSSVEKSSFLPLLRARAG